VYMSAFLGKIHYWLYNKILLQEKLIGDITELAKEKGYSSNTLLETSYSKYGFPVVGELEDVIEHSNIHGWLQEQIIGVESRLAYVITELVKTNTLTQEEITNVFFQDGEIRGNELGNVQGTPEDFFQLIFDYLLEGMPCDRVNNITANTAIHMSWETTRDLHQAYWDQVGGDIRNYNCYRNAWINGFLLVSEYEYQHSDDGINTIRKV